MQKTGAQLPAVITVTFTLLSVIYLGVIGMLIESARIQGARAQTANITDMGNMSLFSEYERRLFEDYGIFALDGAAGTGEYSISRMEGKLKQYLTLNASPKQSGGLSAFFFDPWMVSLKDCRIKEYTLLTDNGCEAFYQQAAAYMRQTALMQAGASLMEHYRSAQDLDAKRENYEKSSSTADADQKALETKQDEVRKEQEEAAAASGQSSTTQVSIPSNPLFAIARLKRKDIFKLVCGNAAVSSRSVRRRDLVSARSKKRGNLKQKKIYSGLLNDLLFREYLLDHFSCWGSEDAESGRLRYGLEYIIAGKKSDKANLKAVVIRLLALREGCNYACSLNDAGMMQRAGGLAAALTGWTGLPELTALMQHLLLLAWSYGESLLDVRTLMMGGRVPFIKTADDWEVQLENLGSLGEMMEKGRSNQKSGQDYRAHLRILLYLQGTGQQKQRGLDLIEMKIRAVPGLSSFRADHCIVTVRDETTFRIPAHFSRISAAMLGVSGEGMEVKVRGGYSYMSGEG